MEKIFLVDIDELKPTQSGLGLEEVSHKIKRIKKMTKEEFEAYIDEKVVPVVIGPNKHYYLIDHHHYAISMKKCGHKKVKATVVADLSEHDTERFWHSMMSKKWVWLYKPDGTKINPSQLPKSLDLLENDPYRSLAWGVRESKGFNPEDKVPFFEFSWGNYYRLYLTQDLILKDFKLATEIAMKLSTHSLAKHLPGFKGNSK